MQSKVLAGIGASDCFVDTYGAHEFLALCFSMKLHSLLAAYTNLYANIIYCNFCYNVY